VDILSLNTIFLLLLYVPGYIFIRVTDHFLLKREKSQFDYEYKKSLVNEAKSYTVSLFKYQFDRLYNSKAIYEIVNSGIYALEKKYYDDTLGVYENGGDAECDILIL